MKIFYYTATGNSLFAAKKLSEEIYSIPQILNNDKSFFKADKIGIVFPNYYLGTPNIVIKFLEKVKLEADYIFAIITYGNFSGNAVYNFSKIAVNNGINLNFADELLMVDNYLPMFDIAKQKQIKDNKKIDNNLEKIVKRINDNENFILRKNLFNSLASWLAKNYYKKQKGDFDKNFYVNNTCTSCGICSKVCPFKNISIKNKPIFKKKCEQCMACINLCPENAIHLKNQKSQARFLNPHIDISEIIKSNNIERERQ